MSLLMLKTKNLSWQDHTLNIEAMLAPLRSTLLLNKHKTLDAKFDQEKALYQRQRDACIKDFVVEKRLIERRRQKILTRKKEILQEVRSQSAMEQAHETKQKQTQSDKERSFSAPTDRRLRGDAKNSNRYDPDGVAGITSSLPRLTLKANPLLGGNPLRPRLFLETGNTHSSTTSTTPINAFPAKTPSKITAKPPMFELKDSESKKITGSHLSGNNVFITGDSQTTTSHHNKNSKTPKLTKVNKKDAQLLPQQKRSSSGAYFSRPPKTPDILKHGSASPPNKTILLKETPMTTARSSHKRIPNVTFLGLLNNDDYDDDNDVFNAEDGRIMVEVKQKSVEDKVRDFLKDLEVFNSRPPTALDENDDAQSVFSSVRSREIHNFNANKQPIVANRYNTLTLDKKLLEKAFDRYMEKRSHEDLLKAMKLAAKMKAHIRQARNTSLVPTMAAFKSSRTFLKILKRQQRREKQSQAIQ